MLTELDGIKEAAQRLADLNAEAVPEIQEIWLFPNDREIRLIEVHPLLPPDDEIIPFHFPADPVNGVGYPIAVALVSFVNRELHLPEDWGSWDSAKCLYTRTADGQT